MIGRADAPDDRRERHVARGEEHHQPHEKDRDRGNRHHAEDRAGGSGNALAALEAQPDGNEWPATQAAAARIAKNSA
jgi:hypothetical protein